MTITPSLLFFGVIIGFFIVIIILLSAKSNKPVKPFKPYKNKESLVSSPSSIPYVLNSSILTERETSFFNVLYPIASNHQLLVLIKPRIADFIIVTAKQYEKGSGFRRYFNQIAMKHIDFLLCDKNFKPVIGFEVDDNTHSRPSRIARDSFVDGLYGCVGLKVIHVFELSNTDKIKQIITDSIISPADVKENIVIEEHISDCPRCGNVMSKKVNSKSGEMFYGCSGFPKCRYTSSDVQAE